VLKSIIGNLKPEHLEEDYSSNWVVFLANVKVLFSNQLNLLAKPKLTEYSQKFDEYHTILLK